MLNITSFANQSAIWDYKTAVAESALLMALCIRQCSVLLGSLLDVSGTVWRSVRPGSARCPTRHSSCASKHRCRYRG